jgi:putative oxidoreductase
MAGEQPAESSGPLGSGRVALRIVIAGLVLGPGVNKFLTYQQSVQFFQTLGLPMPALTVVLVGAVELVVAALLLLDRLPRVAAVLVVPVMVVAAATAGPTWQNLGVLLGASTLLVLETRRTDSTPTESTE